MERRPARSPQDSSFLRTPSTHPFVTYSTSSTSNLASTYRELPRAAIGNSSKCHLHDVRRYSRRVLPFVSGERFPIITAPVEWATFPGRANRAAGESFRRRSPIRSRGALLRVLRPPIAKRPLLLLHLHQADASVLATNAHCFVESVVQCPIESAID